MFRLLFGACKFEFEDEFCNYCPVELKGKTPLLVLVGPPRALGVVALLALLVVFVWPEEVSAGSEPMKLFMMLKLLLITLPLACMF